MESLIASFFLGLASAASPCLLPLYPAFLALLAARRDDQGRRGTAFLGLVVVLGVVTTLLVIGLAVTAVSVSLGGLLGWIVPISTVLLVALAILLIAGRNPFETITAVRMPVVGHPIAQAYVYGLLYGPVALPCAGPFIVALLAISLSVGEATGAVVEFVAFGLGFGAPLIALSLVGATRAHGLTTFLARHHLAIGRVAGVLLIVAALAEPVQVGIAGI